MSKKIPEHSGSLNILFRSAAVVVRRVLAGSLFEATSVAVVGRRPGADTGCVEACVPSGMQATSWGNDRDVGDPFVYDHVYNLSEVMELEEVAKCKMMNPNKRHGQAINESIDYTIKTVNECPYTHRIWRTTIARRKSGHANVVPCSVPIVIYCKTPCPLVLDSGRSRTLSG